MSAMTIAVCYGAGWDSSGLLITMAKQGIRPDLITMADTGGEKPKTYEFLDLFQQWLADQGFPPVTICEYAPLDGTAAKYRQAVLDMTRRLKISLSDEQIRRLSLLYGNMLANYTLPGIAFGPKSCSLKWKLEAQEPT